MTTPWEYAKQRTREYIQAFQIAHPGQDVTDVLCACSHPMGDHHGRPVPWGPRQALFTGWHDTTCRGAGDGCGCHAFTPPPTDHDLDRPDWLEPLPDADRDAWPDTDDDEDENRR